MRSSRLLALLMLLQRRRRATAAELAEELEVSVRTLYRDIAALTAAGVPLWTETGPGGGVRLVDGWRTRLDGLTGDEASALFLSGAPQAVTDLGLAAVYVSAKAKVDATLPEELRGRAERIRERFHLDAPSWFTRQEPLAALPVVADAVWRGRRLDVRYGEQRAARRLDPLGLVLKAGVWYVVARHRGALKSFRISRLSHPRLREEPVERPHPFDLAAWWRAASSSFERSLLAYRCRVRLSPSAQRLIVHVVPNEAVAEMVEQASPPDDEGWRTAELWLESEDVAAFQLVALGEGVEVLEPQALRRRLREVAERMAARHAPRRRAPARPTASGPLSSRAARRASPRSSPTRS